MIRRITAATAALAALTTTAALAAPASAVLPDHRAPVSLLDSTYGPGYSPAVSADDSYYPEHGDPGIDVLTYDLSVRWDPKKRVLTGTAVLHLRAVSTAPQITLDLAHAMTASSVKVGVLDATSTHDGGHLVVNTPVEAGQTYDVTIDYSGTPGTLRSPSSRVDLPRVGWKTMSDGQAWTMQAPYGASTWYPANELVADKAIYSLQLDVPDKWIGVSNGTMTRAHVGNRMITRFTNQHPMPTSLVTLAIGPYVRAKQTGPDGLPLTYWYPSGKSALLDPLKATPKTLSWLEGKLGPFPFERLSIVLVPSDSALEGSTMLALGRGNYRYGNRDVRETVLHQLVNAWYGGTVTPSDWRDVWMNEGIATYLEARYSVAKGWKPWSHWRHEFNRNDLYWRSIYGPPGAYAKRQFMQRNVSYCTALMLLRLRDRIGPNRFDSAVRRWPQTHKDSSRNRNGYVSWLEGRTGKELSAFFNTELNDTKPTL